MSRLSLELEENKRLPGCYPVSMSDASLSAAIQMSCVASAATSRCRRGRQRPGLTPAAPSSPLPHLPPHPPPSSPAPSGRPRPSPSPATVTHRHSRLPLPAPGAVPACQPPDSTGHMRTTENVAENQRQLTSPPTAASANCLPITIRCKKKN